MKSYKTLLDELFFGSHAEILPELTEQLNNIVEDTKKLAYLDYISKMLSDRRYLDDLFEELFENRTVYNYKLARDSNAQPGLEDDYSKAEIIDLRRIEIPKVLDWANNYLLSSKQGSLIAIDTNSFKLIDGIKSSSIKYFYGGLKGVILKDDINQYETFLNVFKDGVNYLPLEKRIIISKHAFVDARELIIQMIRSKVFKYITNNKQGHWELACNIFVSEDLGKLEKKQFANGQASNKISAIKQLTENLKANRS